jgi:hypothetical protein
VLESLPVLLLALPLVLLALFAARGFFFDLGLGDGRCSELGADVLLSSFSSLLSAAAP